MVSEGWLTDRMFGGGGAYMRNVDQAEKLQCIESCKLLPPFIIFFYPEPCWWGDSNSRRMFYLHADFSAQQHGPTEQCCIEAWVAGVTRPHHQRSENRLGFLSKHWYRVWSVWQGSCRSLCKTTKPPLYRTSSLHDTVVGRQCPPPPSAPSNKPGIGSTHSFNRLRKLSRVPRSIWVWMEFGMGSSQVTTRFSLSVPPRNTGNIWSSPCSWGIRLVVSVKVCFISVIESVIIVFMHWYNF